MAVFGDLPIMMRPRLQFDDLTGCLAIGSFQECHCRRLPTRWFLKRAIPYQCFFFASLLDHPIWEVHRGLGPALSDSGRSAVFSTLVFVSQARP